MKIHRNIADAVIRSLYEIFDEHRYADKVIERTLKSNPRWGARDRRFIAETTYEIVRWYRLLQEVTPQHSGRPEDIFGTYCGWKDENPDEDLLTAIASAREVRRIGESIPDWMDDLGEKELGEEKWNKELHSLNEEAKVVLRVNTLKIKREDLQKKLHEGEIDTLVPNNYPDALLLSKRKNVFTSAAFKEGLFEVQDASSQLVAPFMDLKNGMRVVDACAGAGGKSLHISALMQNKGKVISMDNVQWKLDELKKRARRAGASNIETRLADSSAAIKRLEGSADRLLLDVPCSGLGVLKRNPDAKWKLSPEFIEETKILQQKILNDYSAMLKPGGKLVYSTCSILPSENEEQVQKFISEQKGSYKLEEQRTILPSEGFDGFFMARMKRVS